MNNKLNDRKDSESLSNLIIPIEKSIKNYRILILGIINLLIIILTIFDEIFFQKEFLWLFSMIYGTFLLVYIHSSYIKRKKTEFGLIYANKVKTQFLANMSHELRTPLNSIIGFSDIIMHILGDPLTHEQIDCLININRSGNHLLLLINDILDITKIESESFSLEKSEFDLKNVLEQLFSEFSLNNRKLEFIHQISDDIGLIIADERRIKQVILNLISNSVKFTNDGGKISLRAYLELDKIHILIADTGIGIRPEDINKLFEKFSKINNFSVDNSEGTGLGLYLSKKFINMHNGDIKVKSTQGKGTEFEIILPLVRKPIELIKLQEIL